MNREIKFRGKILKVIKKHHPCKAGEWVYGDLLHTEHDFVRGIDIVTDDFSQVTVDANTIGQFTGLKDKKGNEVYEGDVIYVEFDDGSHGNSIIGWNNDMYCFGMMTDYEYCSRTGKYEPHVLLNFLREAERFEVIGNVVDNPKLLKK